MATSPIPQPQGGPPQGGPPSPQGQGPTPTGQVLQMVAIIDKASSQLAKVFPPSAPMADQIQNLLQQIQQKISETQSPSQPAAPPI